MIAGKNTLKCRAELSQHSATAPWGGNKMEDRHRGCVNWCQYQRSGRVTLRCRSPNRFSTHSHKTFPQKQRQNRLHKHTHTWFWMVQSGNTHEKSMGRTWQICSVPISRRATYLDNISRSISVRIHINGLYERNVNCVRVMIIASGFILFILLMISLLYIIQLVTLLFTKDIYKWMLSIEY